MANSLEYDALTETAVGNVQKMTTEQLKRFQRLMVSGGTPSAGTRTYGYSDILKSGGELETAERARYGVAGLEFGEKKRQFGETLTAQERQFGRELGFKRESLTESGRQFDVSTALQERELSLFEQQLADLRSAQKKSQKNWWQQYVGQIFAIGGGTVLGSGLSKILGITK